MVITGVSLVVWGLFLAFGCVSSSPAAPTNVKKPSQDPPLPGRPTVLPQMSGQVQKCQVQDYERVPCGEPGIKAARCNAINCCFDGQQCYYGKTGEFGVLFVLIVA